METRPPTVTRILIAVAFAISCFGIALFLWIAFGGPIPLKPESYRFSVPFEEATQLAQESDVRISGVSVGKVKSIELGDANDAVATVELEPEYAPIPTDTRAILRSKTLLGETYVELSPGDGEGPDLAEGGSLPAAQVSESVQLDEIFRAFDEPTRAAFQAWMQGQAAAFEGRGDDFSVAIASLDPFAEQADEVLRILDSQRLAVRRLVADGGEVFQAFSERRGQLRGLIENSEAVFSTTAARDAELAETFRVFPTFLRESRATLARLEQFSRDTDPLVQQLRPAARELSPTLVDLGALSPELESFFIGLDGTIQAAPSGFGALRALLDDDLPPFLARANGFFAELNSILEVAELYKHEITAFFANAAAATNGGLAEPNESSSATCAPQLRSTPNRWPRSRAGWRRTGPTPTSSPADTAASPRAWPPSRRVTAAPAASVPSSIPTRPPIPPSTPARRGTSPWRRASSIGSSCTPLPTSPAPPRSRPPTASTNPTSARSASGPSAASTCTCESSREPKSATLPSRLYRSV